MPSPLTETRQLVDLTRILRITGLVDSEAEFDDAELLVGWEGAVVRTADGWIYRFARTSEATFNRELKVLALIDDQLGVPTPRVERTNQQHLVMAYRTITGSALDLPRIIATNAADRAPLTRSLATVLAAMHNLEYDSIIDLPGVDHSEMVGHARQAASQASGAQADQLAALIADWESCSLAEPAEQPVLLHGDFHPGNMVFGSEVGPITGLWDFSCVEHGDPANDFRYLVSDSYDLAAEVADHYAELTGREVDLAAAQLIATIEQVSDAVVEDRLDSLTISGN